MGTADLFLPRSRDSCRFMNMAVQGDQGLPALDKPLNGNAAHMNIQRGMLHIATVKGGAVQAGLIGRRMKKKNSSLESISGAEIFKIILDSMIMNFFFAERRCQPAFFGRRCPGINEMRYVIALPIF